MSEFIVLGLIPGTHIQITFVLWAMLVSLVGVSCMVWLVRRTRAFRNWIVTFYLLVIMRRTVLQP